MKTNRKLKKGFTLIELLVVVAILGVLMLIAIPNFVNATNGAKIRTFESSFRTLMYSINSSLSRENGRVDKIADDIAPILAATNQKPQGATYSYDPATLTLTATLTANMFNGTSNYVLTYHAETMKVTQNPDPLPNGATKLAQY